MRDKMARFLTAFLLLAAGLTATAAVPAAPGDRPAARKPIIGDFSAEIRRRDGIAVRVGPFAGATAANYRLPTVEAVLAWLGSAAVSR